MPCITRLKNYDEVPETNNERKLNNLRLILQGWKDRGLGFQYPATPAKRLDLGDKIGKVKSDLIESRLYEPIRTA